MDELRLDLCNVSANYGPRMVLHDVSLSLHQHETLVVSGANGSGKSTLLRLLCGLQSSTGGTIEYTWNGAQYAPTQARHLLGWVAPDLALYRELTAHENLHFFAAVRRFQCSGTHIDALLEQLGLGGRGHDRVASYSSGMTHRLRYAYALLHQPPILVLDEPTVTLDDHGSALIYQLIEKQRSHGMTIIATNDSRELRFGDYVLTLNTLS